MFKYLKINKIRLYKYIRYPNVNILSHSYALLFTNEHIMGL